MPLYEVTDMDSSGGQPPISRHLAMYERQDLQRMLRNEIGAHGVELLIISKEFGSWEDARRRIDLLALDKSGRVVVIELKRGEDGWHMELQSIRYAEGASMGVHRGPGAYTAQCQSWDELQGTDAATYSGQLQVD